MNIKTPVVSHEISVQLQKLAMDDAVSRWFAGVFFKSFLLSILMMIPLFISLLPLSYSWLGIASRRTRTALPLRGLFGRL